MTTDLPDVIGGFKVERELGQGGMGKVYVARQESLDRLVALKVLLPKFAEDAEFLARFNREAKAAALFQHPNVVAVIDAGTDARGVQFIAFEFVEGGSLESLLGQRKKLPEQEALRITHGMLEALAFAEAKGIVHRDVKPDNVLLGVGGIPKLADLGLAKLSHDTEAAQLTQTGAVMGTPVYMAPEQGLGEPLDIRADLYAVGLCLWRMLAGELPFVKAGDSALQIISKHINKDLQDVREVEPGVSEHTARFVQWLSAREKEGRYPTADAAGRDLQRILAGNAPEGPAAVGLQVTVAMDGSQIADTAAAAAAPTVVESPSSKAITAPPPRAPTAVAVAAPPAPSSIPVPVLIGSLFVALAIGALATMALIGGGSSPPAVVVAPPSPAPPGPVADAPVDDDDPSVGELPDPDPPAVESEPDPEFLAKLDGGFAEFLATLARDVDAASTRLAALQEGLGPAPSALEEDVDLLFEAAWAILEGLEAEDEDSEQAALATLERIQRHGSRGEVGVIRRRLLFQAQKTRELGAALREVINTPGAARTTKLLALMASQGRDLYPQAHANFLEFVAQRPSLRDPQQAKTALENPLVAAGITVFLATAPDDWPGEKAVRRIAEIEGLGQRVYDTVWGHLLEDLVDDAFCVAQSLGEEGASFDSLFRATCDAYLYRDDADGVPSDYLTERLVRIPVKADGRTQSVPFEASGLLIGLDGGLRGEIDVEVGRDRLQLGDAGVVWSGHRLDLDSDLDWSAVHALLVEAQDEQLVLRAWDGDGDGEEFGLSYAAAPGRFSVTVGRGVSLREVRAGKIFRKRAPKRSEPTKRVKLGRVKLGKKRGQPRPRGRRR